MNNKSIFYPSRTDSCCIQSGTIHAVISIGPFEIPFHNPATSLAPNQLPTFPHIQMRSEHAQHKQSRQAGEQDIREQGDPPPGRLVIRAPIFRRTGKTVGGPWHRGRHIAPQPGAALSTPETSEPEVLPSGVEEAWELLEKWQLTLYQNGLSNNRPT